MPPGDTAVRRLRPLPAPSGGQAGEPRTLPCCFGLGDEHFTWCPLIARVTDRRGDRYVSPLGAERERACSCTNCGDPDVWALDALCDRCATKRAVRALTHLDGPAREAMLR